MDEQTKPLLNAVLETAKAILTAAERKSASSYRSGIFDAARAYWKEGVPGNFYSRMKWTIRSGLNEAWNAGAAACGVSPDEYEDGDKAEIERIIGEEYSHVGSLLDHLNALANDPTKTFADATPRLEMWAGRWQDVYNQALVWFGGKLRLKWVYGPTEHCQTCLSLNGIVAWAKEWQQADIRPQSRRLACHGYRCKCKLEPTTQRRSPRALERIMDIVVAGTL